MKYSKLRIVWSVAWGLLAVLLCVLWVRSYTPIDELKIPIGIRHIVHSDTYRGKLRVLSSTTSTPRRFDYGHVDVADGGDTLYTRRTFYFALGTIFGTFELWLPFWFLTFVGTGSAVLPWLPWRFSLRTLLLAVTLVAMVLGLIIYFANR